MLTLYCVEDGKLHRALAFITRKDGAVNESGAVRGNANINLVQLFVALFVLIAFNSWKMAIKNTANGVANVLYLILPSIWHYTCTTQIVPKTRSYYSRNVDREAVKKRLKKKAESKYLHSPGRW